MKVLFVDMVAPKPFTCHTLRSYAMGGSEATLLRVARGLAALPGYQVYLFQGCDPHRAEMAIDGITHVPESAVLAPDVVVHMRSAFFVEGFKEAYPKARHLIWLHDVLTLSQLKEEGDLAGQEIVCVSQWHREQVLRSLPAGWSGPLPAVVYNPVSTEGAVRQAKVPGRLGFFSSPHKGLDRVVGLFKVYRQVNADLHLVVANPGYVPDQCPKGVTFLGQLPHHKVLEEMSKCEVLFYPQSVFPETFGLVMAEANAMGAPVLAHDFGAAKEVLGERNGNYVVDCTHADTVREALDELLTAKPVVCADPRFSLENVIAEWRQLLEGTND